MLLLLLEFLLKALAATATAMWRKNKAGKKDYVGVASPSASTLWQLVFV